MRLQLTDDTIQSIIQGLYHPDDVDFAAAYDTVGLTISYGGVPVTVVATVSGPHSQGRETKLRAYPATVGPTDQESTPAIQSRRIYPTESTVEKYIYYMTSLALNSIEELDQSYELKFYDPVDESRMTARVDNDGAGLPGHIESQLRNDADPHYAAGVDVSGVELWAYPIKSGVVEPELSGFLVSDATPEDVYQPRRTLPQPALRFYNRRGILSNIASPKDFVPSSLDSVWVHVIGATVSNANNPNEQRHLSDFMSADGLDFSPTHDALV
jgi:hypothetical protein